MRRPILCALAIAIAALVLPAAAAAAVQLTPFGQVSKPMYVTAPPGDAHRVFVAEKDGGIAIVRDGVTLPAPFLVVPGTAFADERGLLSMAFAPDYAQSGRFYVFYAGLRNGDASDPGDELHVDEYRRSAGDPDRADPATRRTVLTIDHRGAVHHNGGQLQFGPDGYLYISTGDGGYVPDSANPQSTAVLLGKLLRIDPRQAGPDPYSVPPDNPFVGVPGARPEIWAYGLRNPYRFSFDRATGDLAFGDVGQDTWEEIDFAPQGTGAGVDYGWDCKEGMHDNANLSSPCTPSGTYVPPVFEYGHRAESCGGAVIGGYVVRDPDLGPMVGRYLYADFCSGEVHSQLLATPAASDDRLEATIEGPTSFGEDACGHLFLITRVEVRRLTGSTYTPCPDSGAKSGPTAKPPDTRAPSLEITQVSIHPLSRKTLYMRARCDELCRVLARASLSVPGAAHPYRLGPLMRTLSAAVPANLALRLPRHARHLVKRALGAGHRVRVHLKAVARDPSGNQTVVRRRVKLTR
ncbi:MAG: hypothetical protein QOD53_639 [Thermoleophilaceae bacterium]|nr:hypothetical protein [Thermoleophilaceae bacterium]